MLPKSVPNIVLRQHAGFFPTADMIKDLAFGFGIIQMSLSRWSHVWDVKEGGLESLASNMLCIYDVLDEFDFRP